MVDRRYWHSSVPARECRWSTALLSACIAEGRALRGGLWDSRGMGIFRRGGRAKTNDDAELVDLPVGYDRTAAFMIVARCEAEGIPIRLLTMDENGLAPGIAALAEHRVLVREEDRERVDAIIRQG